MAEHNGAPQQPGFEPRDVNVRALSKLAFALIAICTVALLALAGLYRFFQSREAALQPPADTLGANARGIPPEPRLQNTPIADLKQIRDSEDQILGSYGWLDRDTGVIRIPVSRAMELLAQRGLPARSGVPPERPVSIPAESGLGESAGEPMVSPAESR
jgi:hypothetical protein